MSTVKISGNASGTGTFEIASPNSNTNRTQTLPDATGTVVLDSATQTLTNKTLSTGLVMGVSVITSGTVVASTSGTSIDFTSIPSWVKRITVMFSGVSTNGTSGFGVQAGTSGGVVATGYLGSTSRVGAPTSATLSTGFIFNSNSASDVSHGDVVLVNVTGNTWAARGTVGQSNVGQSITVAGVIALSGVLTQVRVTTGNGTDTFDAGSINILYE